MSSYICVMNRGDSKSLKINILNELEFPNNNINSNIFFGLMFPFQKFEDAIIKKIYSFSDLDSDGNLEVILNPKDTLLLDTGVYYYSIKVQQIIEDKPVVTTIISKTKLIIND